MVIFSPSQLSCLQGLAAWLPLGSSRISRLWRPRLFQIETELRTQMARPDPGTESSALKDSDPARQGAVNGAGAKLGAQSQPPGLGRESGTRSGGKMEAGECVLQPLRLPTAVTVQQRSSDPTGQLSLVTHLKRGPLNPSSPLGAPGTPAGSAKCVQAQGVAPSQQGSSTQFPQNSLKEEKALFCSSEKGRAPEGNSLLQMSSPGPARGLKVPA